MSSSTPQRSRAGRGKPSAKWRRMDLHIHTPGSNDYQEPGVEMIDILRQAEIRGLDILAMTDHNTVAGFAMMKKELERLLWLEELGRMEHEEQRLLNEYRRLLDKILVLPGFEFTATFGFHILGIFPTDTSVSFLEYLLLSLNVPSGLLQQGSSTVGATSDVLTAYRTIHNAGGLVIAAHANSGNGVAMRGMDFGGQTRIAYTQDPHLLALEVTDLDRRGRYTTRRFFDGSKPEYPRPMRCIQGSDAHRLVKDPAKQKSLGIGDRITEIWLEEVSFDALAEVLRGNDFSLTRAYRGPANPIDFVQLAREEGESIVQSFHRSAAKRGGHEERILEDICAMANGNGGTVYVGVSANPSDKPDGVREPKRTMQQILKAVDNRFSPEPDMRIDGLRSKGKQIVRVVVQPGTEKPYAIDDNRFYVLDETETSLAVRDEIVRLAKHAEPVVDEAPTPVAPVSVPPQEHRPPSTPRVSVEKVPEARPHDGIRPPRTGVEIVSSENRNGVLYHTVRDLRNGNLIKNVTKSSARKLWHYAISQVEAGVPDAKTIKWKGRLAVLKERKRNDNVWYDLAMRGNNGDMHVYYGVTDSGMNEDWLSLVEQSE